MRHLLLFLYLLFPLIKLAAYNPDDSNIHTKGKFVFEIAVNNGKPTGYATLIAVRPGAEMKGEITLPGSITVDSVRYVVNHIGDIYSSEHFFDSEIAFKDFPEITRINIPSTVTDIGYMEFLGCTGINEFHVNAANKNFKDVDGVLFYRWQEGSNWHLFRMPPARPKTKYTIPDDVQGIEQCAFADNKTLRTLILSELCSLHDPLWCWGNKSIREIDVSKNNWYDSEDGILFQRWGTGRELISCPPGLKLDSYTVPSDCIGINGGAFCNSSISKIKIPDTAWIDGYAFIGSDLEELECGASSLKGFSPDICLMCEKLTKVHIIGKENEKVEIGRFSFALCPNLKEVKIDSQNVEIRSAAFYCCSSLEDFPFESIVSLEGDKYSGHWSGRQFQGSGISSVIFPSTIERVPAYCFSDCPNLNEVHFNLDENLTRQIWEGAFQNCSSLERINLKGVNEIDGGAFEGTQLKTIIVPERDKDDGELKIGSCFEFSPETKCYFDTPYISWFLAYGSANDIPGQFITSTLSKDSHSIPNYWEHLYCPYGMKEWYDNNSHQDLGHGGPVTELFSLSYSDETSYITVSPNPELEEITFEVREVYVDGAKAEKVDDENWEAAEIPASSREFIRIGYSVDGVPMSTTYPVEYTTSVTDASVETKEIKGIYDISGVYVGKDVISLKPGMFIILYNDGTSRKTVISK